MKLTSEIFIKFWAVELHLSALAAPMETIAWIMIREGQEQSELGTHVDAWSAGICLKTCTAD